MNEDSTPIMPPRYFVYLTNEKRFQEVSKLTWRKRQSAGRRVAAKPTVNEDKSIAWGFDVDFYEAHEEVFANLDSIRAKLPTTLLENNPA